MIKNKNTIVTTYVLSHFLPIIRKKAACQFFWQNREKKFTIVIFPLLCADFCSGGYLAIERLNRRVKNDRKRAFYKLWHQYQLIHCNVVIKKHKKISKEYERDTQTRWDIVRSIYHQ